ncbi:uncharacterized protein LOC128922190 [Zeugodacus cucurbitae]|uniref:uncharacterized protein LOC128922190 n=1 Tax=Zeugodacus cucurbitae TaxID=28588 RepID=UPI0023D902E1|nr:uncharacterized protein LOC128922190 [Zeugodacus cucurbitae]
MGQESDPFEISDDVEDDEYFPDEDDFGEASDIEQEIELEAVLDENHDDIEDLYREAVALEASTTMESCSTSITQGLIYRSKDGRMWNSNPPPPGRPRCQNVTTFTRKGPLRGASPSHKALFKLLLSPEIVPESCPSTSDATQQQSYAQVASKRSSCYHCASSSSKKRRKTRYNCSKCNRPICLNEHSMQLYSCKPNCSS